MFLVDTRVHSFKIYSGKTQVEQHAGKIWWLPWQWEQQQQQHSQFDRQ